MSEASFSDHFNQIKEGNITLPQIVSGFLQKIDKSKTNAFLSVFGDEALQDAEKIQIKINKGSAGKLAGMVIAIKDNICYKNHKVSASSKILEGFESIFSASAIERILAEDAIIIGRLNCDEFAMGGSNENSAYGNVLNPLDYTKVPGGSSGGSAAAVAENLCHAALGSDTGGSIRQPASFCGTVGLKPTYGRISRHGLIAYASSFDQIGPITKNIYDAALLLEIMAGNDAFDSTASSTKVDNYAELKADYKPKKIAYLSSCLEHNGIDKEVKEQTEKYINELKKDGHTVEAVDFDLLEFLVPTYYVITTAEASSNLARFDGIHYGYRSKEAKDIEDVYIKSRSEGFGTEVKRRIMLGTFVLSTGYYDAYFAKAQKVRRLIKEKTEHILSEYDYILSPTTPHPAFKLGANSKDPIAMYLEDIFTVQANLAGVPAISLPLFTHSNGMPFGLQLMANHFKEADLLAFSNNLMNK